MSNIALDQPNAETPISELVKQAAVTGQGLSYNIQITPTGVATAGSGTTSAVPGGFGNSFDATQASQPGGGDSVTNVISAIGGMIASAPGAALEAAAQKAGHPQVANVISSGLSTLQGHASNAAATAGQYIPDSNQASDVAHRAIVAVSNVAGSAYQTAAAHAPSTNQLTDSVSGLAPKTTTDQIKAAVSNLGSQAHNLAQQYLPESVIGHKIQPDSDTTTTSQSHSVTIPNSQLDSDTVSNIQPELDTISNIQAPGSIVKKTEVVYQNPGIDEQTIDGPIGQTTSTSVTQTTGGSIAPTTGSIDNRFDATPSAGSILNNF